MPFWWQISEEVKKGKKGFQARWKHPHFGASARGLNGVSPQARFSYHFAVPSRIVPKCPKSCTSVYTRSKHIFESHASYCLYVCSRYKSISKISLKKTSEAKNVFVEVRISVGQQPQKLKNLYGIDLCDLKSVDLYGLRSCSRLLSSNFSVISMASEVVILCLFLWPLWPLRPSKARTRRKAIFSHRRCDILQVTSYSGTCCVSKFIPFSPQNLNCFCAWGSSRSIIAASWNFCSRYSAQIYGPISGAASRESQDTNLLISILWKLP